MARRAYFGKLNGSFVARVTKPGYDVADTNIDRFSLHETMRPIPPTVSGFRQMAANTQYNFNVPKLINNSTYSFLKCNQGILPMSPYTEYAQFGNSVSSFPQGQTYYLLINPKTGDCRLVNGCNITLDIHYYIFTNYT